jgi:hypothetical protein
MTQIQAVAKDNEDNFCSIFDIAQKPYLVEVTQQGILVATHTVEAPDALTAINLVERSYSEPAKLEEITVEDEVSNQQQGTVANNWHGYMFQAQAI